MQYYKAVLTNTYLDSEGQEHAIAGALAMDCYIELDVDGNGYLRYCAVDGETIVIPSVQEIRIVDTNPERLEWMA